MQITRATAAQPGYGMPPLDPSVLTDPAHGQQNLEWGLRYEAARAKAAGLDPSSPAGQAQLLGLYNGGGDPNYVQHVQSRMGGQAPAPMTSRADVAADSAPSVPQSSAQQAPGIAYTPPPLPAALQSRLDDSSGLFQSARSRQLLAAAQGFLSGSGAGAGNFSAGLGRAAGNVLQEQDQDNALAMDVYKTQMQQAQAAMLAQRYGGQLMLGGARVQVAQDTQAEKARHDGVAEGIGQQNADTKLQAVDQSGQIGQQNANTRQQAVNQAGAIGADNAATNRFRAQTQAANLGAPPPPSLPPRLPGVGASGLGPMGPAGGPPPASPPQAPPPQAPPPQAPPPQPGPAPAPQGPPPASPQGGLPGVGASGLGMGGPPSGPPPAPPQQPPSGLAQGPAGGPSAPPPVSPTGAPSRGPQGASTGSPAAPPPPSGIPGMGASGLSPSAFAPAGSVYDGEQGGLMSRRQTQNRVQASNHKENEGDTSALEGFASADALADSQRALLAKVQAQNPGITGTGLIAKVQQFIAANTNDPTVQEVQKNASQLTAANYPHGVGALRIPELKVAADQAAGMGQNILAGGHLLDQQQAQRAQMREVLQARQNFIAAHPQEDPSIAFDPVANAYLSQHPAYTEGPNGVVPGQPGLAAFDQAHTNPATGRFDPNYTAVQAGQRAFPQQNGMQSSDPAAAAAGARAFPQGGAQPPASAAPQAAPDPLAAQIKARLQDPAFRQRAVQARGQAWVDHYSQ